MARVRRWTPTLVLIAMLMGAVAYVLPKASRNPLVETTVWSVLVTASFAGWGSLVTLLVAPRERVDLGLRIVWGAAATCFVGGALMSLALMGRTMSLVIVDIGLALAVGSLARYTDEVRTSLRFVGRVARREPRLAVLAGVVGGLLLLQYLAGIADWHTNPYDDDIAYLAFVKKLLDTGTVIEPFSLRRLSALGGQTFFLELVGLRAAPSQGHTFDRSICLLMVVLLILGHRRQGRRLPLVFSIITVLLFLTLQNVAINTASYYSGVAFFFGLFRTLLWATNDRDGRGPVRTAVPIALVGAAICTLRQNYVAVPPLVLGTSYGFALLSTRQSQASWLLRLAEPITCAALSLLALLPWFVVGWQSNRTFFYPVMLGTSNPAMLLTASASTPFRELHTLIWTALEGLPIHLIGLFVLAAALLREPEVRKPVWSLGLGSAGGLVLLVHGLSQGDAGNIGRYACGYIIAFALAVVVTVGTTKLTGAPNPALRRAQIAAAIALFAVLAQLVDSRKTLYAAYEKHFRNIDAVAHSAPRSAVTNPPAADLYLALQNAVPAGAPMAVMLDEPHWLDFGRNRIFNLDMPGYSSLEPGLPYFEGPERVEQYFKNLGVRYLAFVRPGFSRYHYRRAYWMEMLVDEQEMWRAHAPYLIDFYDNLVRLDEKHGRIFDNKGLSVVDLERTP